MKKNKTIKKINSQKKISQYQHLFKLLRREHHCVVIGNIHHYTYDVGQCHSTCYNISLMACMTFACFIFILLSINEMILVIIVWSWYRCNVTILFGWTDALVISTDNNHAMLFIIIDDGKYCLCGFNIIHYLQYLMR